MKNTFIILMVAAMFAACKKNNAPAPQPTASFTFSNNKTNEYSLAATDTTTLISSVTNASGVNWDLGDGRTSTDHKLVLSYPKAGVYTVTLTAISKDGKKVSASKKVTVLDMILKNIIINKVYWNNTDAEYNHAGWPLTNTADVYVKIQKLQGNDVFVGGQVPNAPVVYMSPVLKNVSKVVNVPVAINVSSKVIVDKSTLVNRSYLISLVAKDAAGNEFVLFSNWYSGSEQLVKLDSFSKNAFTLSTSFFSSLDLNFDFE